MFLRTPSPSHPQRIICLVPSITELLYDLYLSAEVVAITKFCVHPAEWFQTKEKIGGTKNINVEKIKALQPDLIIASKEENVQEQIETLSEFFPVYLTDVCTYDDAINMISEIGIITEREAEAITISNSIQAEFDSLIKAPYPIDTTYFIWKDPYMTIGADTFIHDLLEKIGLKNMFSEHDRYPQTSLEELAILNPQLILLSSEPYPFKEKHIKEIQTLLPAAKVMLVDGEMFSWYGSRMKFMPAYFNKLVAELTV